MGAKGAQMVDVRWVGITPSFWALLQGRIEVERLTLFRPTLVLETMPRAGPTGSSIPARAPPTCRGPEQRPASGDRHPEDQGGDAQLHQPDDRTDAEAGKLEALASVGALQGPFEFDASATVNGIRCR